MMVIYLRRISRINFNPHDQNIRPTEIHLVESHNLTVLRVKLHSSRANRVLPKRSRQIALWRFIMKNVLAFGLGLIVAVSLSACAPAAKPAAAAPALGNIVVVAAANSNFTTLVAAVKAAGLVEALSGPGPLTVFAPTNDAFAKLPAGTVEFLLKPENKPRLVAILTYHVLAGKVMAADALKLDGKPAKTLNGQDISVSVKDGNVLLNGAKVLIADVPASNGVIHAIDTVLLPQ